jgi:hypothetical protein
MLGIETSIQSLFSAKEGTGFQIFSQKTDFGNFKASNPKKPPGLFPEKGHTDSLQTGVQP